MTKAFKQGFMDYLQKTAGYEYDDEGNEHYRVTPLMERLADMDPAMIARGLREAPAQVGRDLAAFAKDGLNYARYKAQANVDPVANNTVNMLDDDDSNYMPHVQSLRDDMAAASEVPLAEGVLSAIYGNGMFDELRNNQTGAPDYTPYIDAMASLNIPSYLNWREEVLPSYGGRAENVPHEEQFYYFPEERKTIMNPAREDAQGEAFKQFYEQSPEMAKKMIGADTEAPHITNSDVWPDFAGTWEGKQKPDFMKD